MQIWMQKQTQGENGDGYVMTTCEMELPEQED